MVKSNLITDRQALVAEIEKLAQTIAAAPAKKQVIMQFYL